jgi:hypothetical protein
MFVKEFPELLEIANAKVANFIADESNRTKRVFCFFFSFRFPIFLKRRIFN